jgi:hypothetical protein
MSLSVQLEGGLGNKLFQLAFLHSLSKKFPVIKCYYNALRYYKTSHETVDWSYFTKTFNSLTSLGEHFTSREEHFRHCRYIDYPAGLKNFFIQKPTAHIDLFGYFQSEKYFEEYKNEIYEKFRVPGETKQYIYDKYPGIENSIFLHIRRGDSLRSGCLVFDLEYYERALEEFKNSALVIDVLVCSDDIAWCKKQSLFESTEKFKFSFVEEDEIITLWIMSLCKLGGIAANSTFSWWGAYLNENSDKLILFPDILSELWNTEDHIPSCFRKFEIGDIEKHKFR